MLPIAGSVDIATKGGRTSVRPYDGEIMVDINRMIYFL